MNYTNGMASGVATAPFRAVGLETLGNLAAREPDGWVVDGLLPANGTAMVIGAQFAGKSSMLAGISAAVAAGVPFAGRDTQQGPVVWVYQDRGSVRAFHENLAAAVRGLGYEPNDDFPIHVISPTGWTLDNDSHIEWLREYLDGVAARMVVLDALRRMSAFDENRSQETTEVARRIGMLTSNCNRLAVPVHHVGKDGKTRGSTDLEAASESVVRVDSSKDGCINARARHHGAAEFHTRLRIERDGEGVRFAAEASAPVHASTPLAKRSAAISSVMSTLKEKGPLNTSQLRRELRATGFRGGQGLIEATLGELVADEDIVVTLGARGSKTYALNV